MDRAYNLTTADKLPELARMLADSDAPFMAVDLRNQELREDLPQLSWDEFTRGQDLSNDLAAWVCADAIDALERFGWALCLDLGDGPAVWLRPANLAALID